MCPTQMKRKKIKRNDLYIFKQLPHIPFMLIQYYFKILLTMGSKCFTKTNPSSTKKTSSPKQKLIQQSHVKFSGTNSSLFSHLSCPVENTYISDAAAKLGIVDQYRIESPIWKEIQYNDIRQKLYGICEWQSPASNILHGHAAIYSGKTNSQFLLSGQFNNGKIVQNKQYTKIFGNGSHYHGYINDDLEGQGQGQIFYNSQQRYKGEFVKGIPHGSGEIFSEGKHFIGTVNFGQKQKGKQTSAHGEYEGQFNGNMRDGKGVLKLKNGVKYVGRFSKNKRDGFGTLYGKDGKIEYSGLWTKDEREK